MAAFNNDAGVINTGAAAVVASFQGVTSQTVAAGALVILIVAGWSGDIADGATIDTVTDNQSNTWVEAEEFRKPSMNHTLSLWYTIAAGGSAITATVTPQVPSAVSVWDGVICSFSGMDASPLEQAPVTNNQGTNVTVIETGDITTTVDDTLLIAAGFPIADSFGTITKDSSDWIQIAESESSEPFSALYRFVSAIGTYDTTWTLGFTSQYGPITIISSWIVADGGGGPTLLPGTITLLGVGK